APQRRALPPVKAEAPFVPIVCQPRHLAANFGAIDRLHTARRGELIVPPGDYASGLAPADPHGHRAGGDGIYDVAFLAIDDDGIMFELRTYGDDLTHPRTSQTMSFPTTDKTVRLRHLRIDMVATTAGTITYRIRPDRTDMTDPRPAESGEPATEIAIDECRRDMPDLDLARPQR
ncbi:MAG: hypothetical protein V4564_16530, partial [Pseudomonadota bacterium]